MNEQNNLPRSEFFASLTPQNGPDIKTLDDFLNAEAHPADRFYCGNNSANYGTIPALPPEPRNSPAALSERRRAIRRADMMREVIGWAIVALAIAAIGFILL